MARTEARLRCDIWDGEDFRALTLEAQWLYTAILTQKDLSLCGVITWTPKRFAKLAKNASPLAVRKALDVLRESRYVVLDVDTDELWVRTLIKYDGVLTNHNVFVGMSKAFEAVHSVAIRDAIVQVVREGLGEGVAQGVLEGMAESVLDTLPEPVRKRVGKPFAKALALASASAPAGAHVPPDSRLQTPDSDRAAAEPQSPADTTTKVNYGTPEQKADADAAVKDWWESKVPRPPNDFTGVLLVARRLVASGADPGDVRRALETSPVPTLAALQLELSRQGRPNTLNGRILTDRDGPSVSFIPENFK